MSSTSWICQIRGIACVLFLKKQWKMTTEIAFYHRVGSNGHKGHVHIRRPKTKKARMQHIPRPPCLPQTTCTTTRTDTCSKSACTCSCTVVCSTCTHNETRQNIHKYTHNNIHTQRHTYVHACMHACMHTDKHT